ncbi:Protein CBG17546 [Caenorhabditis briggsae]|uniref:Protein CBG17546 n=1 Tax=Caenorhabditis briggsae TaxID=6238 RepID=A8XR78_CAEBR|nr:Protein CBG17546 [Caenorhabditis briggsae]CAP35175.2 Protein CBG17546 [Caenorhabditis briggsae]
MAFIKIYISFLLISSTLSQWPYAPNHWYGANQGNIRSGIVPDYNPVPNVQGGTLAPHICGFNTFTRYGITRKSLPKNFLTLENAWIPKVIALVDV